MKKRIFNNPTHLSKKLKRLRDNLDNQSTSGPRKRMKHFDSRISGDDISQGVGGGGFVNPVISPTERVLLKHLFVNFIYNPKIFITHCLDCTAKAKYIKCGNHHHDDTPTPYVKIVDRRTMYFIDCGVPHGRMSNCVKKCITHIMETTSVLDLNAMGRDGDYHNSKYMLKNLLTFVFFSPLRVKIKNGMIYLFSNLMPELKRRLAGEKQKPTSRNIADMIGRPHAQYNASLFQTELSYHHPCESDMSLHRREVLHKYVESMIPWHSGVDKQNRKHKKEKKRKKNSEFHSSDDYIKLLFDLDCFKQKNTTTTTTSTPHNDGNRQKSTIPLGSLKAPWSRTPPRGDLLYSTETYNHHLSEYCQISDQEDSDPDMEYSPGGSGGEDNISLKYGEHGKRPLCGQLNHISNILEQMDSKPQTRIVDDDSNTEPDVGSGFGPELDHYKNPFQLAFQLDSLFNLNIMDLVLPLENEEAELVEGSSNDDGDDDKSLHCRFAVCKGSQNLVETKMLPIDRSIRRLELFKRAVSANLVGPLGTGSDGKALTLDDVLWGSNNPPASTGNKKLLALPDRCGLLSAFFKVFVEIMQTKVGNDDELWDEVFYSAIDEVKFCFDKYCTKSEVLFFQSLLSLRDSQSLSRTTYWKRVMLELQTINESHFMQYPSEVCGVKENDMLFHTSWG